MQTSWKRGDKRLLLMAFRASGKSTLAGLFSAWVLWQDPRIRILVLAAEYSLACKMVRNIRKIVETHPLTAHLKPKNPDQWSADRFTVNRDIELRDPSVLGAGVLSNVTGSRADLIIYDDVEVPNTCNTAEKRNSLRERLRETNFVLMPDGIQLYIGTPHSYFSIYADKPRIEIDEEDIFLSGFKRYEQPILNRENESVWPEQFNRKIISLLKRQAGPNKFAAQMMLKPVNVMDSRLDIDLLKFYYEEPESFESQRRLILLLNGKKIVSCSSWWDPAFGKKSGDRSVLAIIFTDEEGNHYIHRVIYINTDNTKGADEATYQCRLVAQAVKKYFIPSVAIETNGIGKFLPAILRRELVKENIICSVVEKNSSQAKSIRILEAFDAVMAAGSLYIHDSIRKTPFLTEMTEWQPGGKDKDDGLDAVAGALSLEPVRLKRLYGQGQRPWTPQGDFYQANTFFDV